MSLIPQTLADDSAEVTPLDRRPGRQERSPTASSDILVCPLLAVSFALVADGRVRWVSRFFTLAHEIAHNLIEPHNSEHEFYFSAICEAHMLALSRLIGAAEV